MSSALMSPECALVAEASYDCSISCQRLSPEEQAVFTPTLQCQGVDGAIWDIYDCLIETRSKSTTPQVVRVCRDGRLAGAAFVVRCRAYGRSVFDSPLLRVPVDLAGLSSYTWIRVGFCAETLANPGFAAPGEDPDQVTRSIIRYLKTQAFGIVIIDTAANAGLHDGANRYRYVSDGHVDVSCMGKPEDYLAEHRNIKRKIASFVNKGGRIETIEGTLAGNLLDRVDQCVQSTVARSVIHSSFQDIFPAAVARTCAREETRLIHFVAYMNGVMLGYHTFLRSGNGLRMLHGAFDRTLKTTHHAYENLIIAAVRYAIENGLEAVHFGPVMNETKRRMMNRTTSSALFFHTGNPLVRFFFPLIFPYTKMQSPALLAFAE